jgi:hypothetical protein
MKKETEIETTPRKGLGLRNGLILMAVVVIFFGALYLLTSYNSATATGDLPVQIIKSVFVDINGDGKLDFIKYGEVVLNTGSLAPSP